MYCTRHSKVETNLRCGKCETPICPKCSVQTPVGARCPGCAKVTRLPIFQVSFLDHLKAVGVGLALAGICGAVLGIIGDSLLFFFYLMVLVTGQIIGDMVSRSVNRKRGRGLEVIAGTSVLAAYAIGVAMGFYVSLFGILALAGAIYIAVGRFR
ncbi:MAG: hypothetical protein PHV74_00930 [Dehalococcoidia bacterium]|nr:hypothetical protein [Dehalococcoidia bacterium]